MVGGSKSRLKSRRCMGWLWAVIPTSYSSVVLLMAIGFLIQSAILCGMTWEKVWKAVKTVKKVVEDAAWIIEKLHN
jgi:hypothetical protein